MGFSPKDDSHVMIQATRKNDADYVSLMWRCAGCGDIHHVHAKGRGEAVDGAPSWVWNGSMTNPTFSPSILKQPNPPSPDFVGVEKRCHSFVREGMVQFLGDCDHKLANQTVEMLPENADPFREEGERRG